MKARKAVAATALVGLVVLGTASGASAMSTDEVSATVSGTLDTVHGLLGSLTGNAAVPAVPDQIDTPAGSVSASGTSVGISLGTVSAQVSVGHPQLPNAPALPEAPVSLPQAPDVDTPELPDAEARATEALVWVITRSDETKVMATAFERDGREMAGEAAAFAERSIEAGINLLGLGFVRVVVASHAETVRSQVPHFELPQFEMPTS